MQSKIASWSTNPNQEVQRLTDKTSKCGSVIYKDGNENGAYIRIPCPNFKNNIGK